MRFFVAHEPERLRQQAAAATQRWAQGRPLSPLDGVPFAGRPAGGLPRRSSGPLARTRMLVTNGRNLPCCLESTVP